MYSQNAYHVHHLLNLGHLVALSQAVPTSILCLLAVIQREKAENNGKITTLTCMYRIIPF